MLGATFEEKILMYKDINEYIELIPKSIELCLLPDMLSGRELNIINSVLYVRSFHIPHHLDKDLDPCKFDSSYIKNKETVRKMLFFAESFSPELVVTHLSGDYSNDMRYIEYLLETSIKYGYKASLAPENGHGTTISHLRKVMDGFDNMKCTLDLPNYTNSGDKSNISLVEKRISLVHLHSFTKLHRGLMSEDMDYLIRFENIIKENPVNLEILHSDNYLNELSNSIEIVKKVLAK